MANEEDIFIEALAKPTPESQAAFLAAACAHDADSLRRLTRLLKAHARLGNFLEGPPAGQPRLPGRYRVEGEVARGGMGVVLAATDEQFGREVAVKVLREGRPEFARRFEEEARIAGRLQHPGVVPVYEMGAEEGRPYFTMKLVRGRTLAELLRERDGPAAEVGKFLAIFEQVCQAVAYAHSRGVIHRDLKPANIMVGAFGEVQVMDWGLAKSVPGHQVAPGAGPEGGASGPGHSDTETGGEAQTLAGSVLGTPAYMAPEQARGENARVGARADVFALGAVLCEVLTGSPPHTGAMPQALEQARKADLASAFARLDACGADGELVALAKRCLAASPAERPEHAGELAEAVTAHRRSVEERLRRAELERAEAGVREAEERKRRRLAVGLAGAVLALVLVGAGAALRMQQLDSRQREEAARQQAERRRDVEAALARAAEFRRQSRWAEARAVLEQARGRLPDGEEALARRAQAALDEIALVSRLEAARVRGSVWMGGGFGQAGVDREYEDAFRAVGLGGPGDPPGQVAERVRASGAREALLAALVDWTSQAGTRGRADWALATARLASEGLGGTHGLYDPGHWGSREGLEKLAREADPGQVGPLWLRALAIQMGRFKAERAPLLRKAVECHPGDFWLVFLLGNCLLEMRREQEAIGYFRAALALRPGNSAAHCNLGFALSETGQNAEAIGHFRKALKAGTFNAAAHCNLGHALYDTGKRGEAEASFREALRVNPRYFRASSALGRIAQNRGNLNEARRLYEQTLAAAPHLAEDRTNLGIILIEQGRVDEGVKCLREAIKQRPGLVPAHGMLGVTLLEKLGRVDEAVCCFEKAAGLQPSDGRTHFNLGIAYSRQGQSDKGIDSFFKAAERNHRRERALENAKTLLAKRLQAARTHASRRDWKAAAEVYARHSPRWRDEALFEHAALRLLVGDEKGHREACALMLQHKRALAVRAALLVPVPEQNPARLELLLEGAVSPTLRGALHLRAGRADRAEEMFRRGLKAGGVVEALSQAWLAVASARRGDEKAARQWTEKARAWADRPPASASLPAWLEVHVLLREAEAGPARMLP